ncbi:hypothetical protein [Streptomyces zaomyceticus]|uniref:hypothetical protein n=1 Tax=Streptomyces zaomyceticus TaxID=68286 RepID=UPI002E20E8C4
MAAAKAQAAKRASERRAAEQRKRDGIWGSIKKGNFGAAWDNTVDEAQSVWDDKLTSADWWKHYGVDKLITAAAVTGTAALCIASAVCGMGLFVVGASVLFVAGLGGHMAVATEEDRRQGATQYLVRTAEAEVKGIALGTLWGRGVGGALWGGRRKQGRLGGQRGSFADHGILRRRESHCARCLKRGGSDS